VKLAEVKETPQFCKKMRCSLKKKFACKDKEFSCKYDISILFKQKQTEK